MDISWDIDQQFDLDHGLPLKSNEIIFSVEAAFVLVLVTFKQRCHKRLNKQHLGKRTASWPWPYASSPLMNRDLYFLGATSVSILVSIEKGSKKFIKDHQFDHFKLDQLFDLDDFLNWTYFIVYTKTNGLNTISHNFVNPLLNNNFYGCTTGNNI